MHRFTILVGAALVLIAMVGCGGSDTASQAEEESQALASQDAGRHGADTDAAAGSDAQFASVEGTMGCGHCNFKQGNSCSLAMQTASGEVLIIEAGDRQDELFSQRMEQPEVKISGKVSEVNGQKVIYAESIEME